jgi:hypothetical protein
MEYLAPKGTYRDPFAKSCWKTCGSCGRCSNKGTRPECRSCSGRVDEYGQKVPHIDDLCRCAEGILQLVSKEGKMYQVRMPNDPFKGKVTHEGKTEDERAALKNGHPKGSYDLGFKGIVIEESNKVRLSSIPKSMSPECVFYYNEDGYSMHCREYREYQTWLSERNTQRYVDIESHAQSIDGKNMMHTRRLLDMAKEIAQGKGINVRRPDADSLISIRQGKVDLQTLLDHADAEIAEIDRLFLESDLPEKVDMELVHKLLVDVRKRFYKMKEDKNVEQDLDKSNQELHMSDVVHRFTHYGFSSEFGGDMVYCGKYYKTDVYSCYDIDEVDCDDCLKKLKK